MDRCQLFENNYFISNDQVIIEIQSMQSQIKSEKIEEEEGMQPHKKYKRSTLNEIEESLRRNKYKQGDLIKNGDQEEQKNKITNYFAAKTIEIKHHETAKEKKEENNKQIKIQTLQEQLKAKEKVIQQLKDKKLAEEQRINRIKFETKQYKNKVKPLIAKNMLQIAETKRAERREKRINLGYFTQGMRNFVEGETLITIRTLIAQKQNAIKKLQEARKSTRGNQQDYVRILSSLEFTHRELNQSKKQLLLREKELATYKDRLKLAEKQNRSHFCREGWPIIYDRYQTLQLLGSGGFGEVYKCFDLDNQKYVAIKRVIFNDRDIGQREDFFTHLMRQAQIQKQLNHPNIARFQSIVQVDKTKNLLIFQLQYCSGPELSVYLRKYGFLQQKQAKVIMKQVFSAIDYLSKLKQRIIHYDLKPSNIMFHEGVVKILDFGLSKIMRGQQSRMELTSQGVGTYWYLPPETFHEDSPQINSKVDVWSLGVIFFELLYGRKPFGHGIGQQQIYNNGVILRAFKVQFPTDTARRRVPQPAKDFIRKCLQYRQEDRLSPSQAYNHDYFRK